MLLNEKHVRSPYGSILFVIVYKKGVLLGYDKTTMLEKKGVQVLNSLKLRYMYNVCLVW